VYGLQQGAGTLGWYSVIPIHYVGETCTVTWCRQSLRLYGKHDISTLRFNFRGTGASTGSHGDGDTEGADVAAAVAYLLSCQPIARLAVAGYSFGAGVGLLAGATDARVAALVG
jgi:alpha/beta superfamily hydrolase